MNKIAFTVSVVAFPALILSTPAIAGCAEDLDALAPIITTGAYNASDEDLQRALTVFDDATASCKNGDEAVAAGLINEVKVALGLNS